MKENSKQKSIGEKKFVPSSEARAYAIAALGRGLVYSCMSSYITDYYMNVLGLNAMFVILLMLLARVWDAINDPLMGIIVDRHQSKKWGRFRIYPIVTALPIAILTVLMFIKPIGFDTRQKTIGMYIYVALVYVIWGMVYTASDVPFWSMPNLMTPNPKERGKVISYGRTIGGIGSAVTVALPIIMGFVLAKNENADVLKYMIMAVSLSAIGMPLFSISSFKIKERIVVPNAQKRQPGERSSLARLFRCKPMMLVVLSGVLSFGRYMLRSAAPHVARYAGFYIGIKDTTNITIERYQKNLSTVALIIRICAAVGMFGAMVLMPKMFDKFEYRTLMIVSCLGGFGASIVSLLVGWFTKNLIICIPFMIISSIPLGVINVVSGAMVADCLDYMELSTGHRDTALGSSAQSFVNKLGNAFATVAIISMYIIVGINVENLNAGSGSTALLDIANSLTNGRQFAMFSLVTIVPGVSLVLCAIPLFFYDLVGEKKEKIISELAKQREKNGIVVDA